MRRTIIAVDFDGTICHNNFPNIGEFYENCSNVINRLQSKGIIVILNTCRCDKLLEQALTACSNNGIIFDAVNENYSKLPFKTSNKIYADYSHRICINGLPFRGDYEGLWNHRGILTGYTVDVWKQSLLWLYARTAAVYSDSFSPGRAFLLK